MIFYLILKTAVIAYALKPLSAFIGELVITGTEAVHNNWVKLGMYLTSYLMTCSRCFAFWSALILSQDLLVAGVTSIIITLIEEDKLKLFTNDKE